MKRKILDFLKTWINSPQRKPLVLRGARQVGKTWIVRQLAKSAGKELIELNFEKDPTYFNLFSSNDPQQILLNLSAKNHKIINPEQSLLFLDEIQTVPQLLAKLRWFAEDMPQLAVVAAGSLLEFVIADHTFSMPVGRINYAHMEPFSFEEFLLACEKEALVNYLTSYNWDMDIPNVIHEQFITLFKEYILIGGLPAAIESWRTERSLMRISQVHQDLLATYRDDFAKFKGQIAIERLDEVMRAVPRMLSQKFVCSRVNPDIQASTIKHVLSLLNKARICHTVWSSNANGVPLAAKINPKYFKEIFLDTGLCCSALGLSFNEINFAQEITLVNQGGIAEQVTGQLLRTINPPYIEPALYYWLREEKTSNAEIDYVIQHGNKVIPVEVKAGSTGSLKSLHLFMQMKNLQTAIRIYSDLPSKTPVNVKDHAGNPIEYQLLSIPFYLIEQIQRLI